MASQPRRERRFLIGFAGLAVLASACLPNLPRPPADATDFPTSVPPKAAPKPIVPTTTVPSTTAPSTTTSSTTAPPTTTAAPPAPAPEPAPDKANAPYASAEEAGAQVSYAQVPVGSKVIYVAVAGSDAASGTESAPVASVRRAIALADHGDTILVGDGRYEGQAWGNLAKRVTIMAAAGATPVMSGAVTLDSNAFVPAGNAYRLSGIALDWPAKPASGNWRFVADQVTSLHPEADEPQQLTIDGVALNQVDPTQWGAHRLASDEFYFDESAGDLYVGTSPTGHALGWSIRQVAVVVRRNPADSPNRPTVIRGITFDRYAPFHGNTLAAVQIFDTNVTLEDVAITNSSGSGLSALGKVDNIGAIALSGLVLNRITVSDNGALGLEVGQAQDLILQNSRLVRNNASGFDALDCGGGANCILAGAKFVRLDGGLITHNLVEDNNAIGLWCDLYCSGVELSANIARNNLLSGIFYEISRAGTIVDNLIEANNGAFIASNGQGKPRHNGGLRITGGGYGTSATTRVAQNVFRNNSNGHVVFGYDTGVRGGETPSWTQGDPNTAFVDNDFTYDHEWVLFTLNGSPTAAWLNGAQSIGNTYRSSGEAATAPFLWANNAIDAVPGFERGV